jgi:hypothetical protein
MLHTKKRPLRHWNYFIVHRIEPHPCPSSSTPIFSLLCLMMAVFCEMSSGYRWRPIVDFLSVKYLTGYRNYRAQFTAPKDNDLYVFGLYRFNCVKIPQLK